MTNDDTQDLGERMKQLEKQQAAMAADIADIKTALLGNIMNGSTGLVGRIRDRERQAENHDLRILSLETQRQYYAEKKELEEMEAQLKEAAAKKDLDELRAQVEENTEWRQRLTWMIAGAAAGGGIAGGGIVAALMRALGG